jgi:hypothetical protein
LLPPGQEVTLVVRERGNRTVQSAAAFFRRKGETDFRDRLRLTPIGGGEFRLSVRSSLAHGSLEYVFTIVGTDGIRRQLGDGDPKKVFKLSFSADPK